MDGVLRASSRRSGLGVRIASITAGLAMGVLLLELLLRVAGLVAPRLLARDRAPVLGAPLRVLCVGDSHTYGAMVPTDQAYPERLSDPARLVPLRDAIRSAVHQRLGFGLRWVLLVPPRGIEKTTSGKLVRRATQARYADQLVAS